MKKYFNKFTMSIIMVVLSALTMIATTYAWVGLATNSTTDNFLLNVKQAEDDDSDYGIELSLTGKEGTFFDEIQPIDLKKQILLNAGYNQNQLSTEGKINEEFRKLSFEQTTVNRTEDYYLTNFRNMQNEQAKYLYFDLYVSVYKIGGDTGADINLDVYLRNTVMTSELSTYYVNNVVNFPSMNPAGTDILGNPLVTNSLPLGTSIQKGNVSMYPDNAARVGIQRHKVVDKYDVNAYTLDNNAYELLIYKNGNDYPTYDATNNIYDFGGVLPLEYNFAALYHNTMYTTDVLTSVPNSALNRGDITFKDDGTSNHIVKESYGVTVRKMIKFTVYFWFEGWDPDCYAAIDNKPVTLNLEFSTKNPND